MLVESECPSQPVYRFVAVPFDNDVLRNGMFLTDLRHGEVGEREEVLVERHVVVDILVAGHSGHHYIVVFPTYGQSVHYRVPAVEAGVVVVDFTCVGRFVSISPLTYERKACHVFQCQTFIRFPTQFERGPKVVFLVAFFTVVHVGEESVGMIAIDVASDAELVGNTCIMGYSGFYRIGVAIFGEDTCALKRKRRQGADIDDSSHRVASVECALRTAHHFHLLDVEDVEVVVVLVHHRNVVDIQSDNRLIDTRSDASDIYGRGYSRTIVGYIHVGDDAAYIF